nr:MAG TPA: hypothetical protein [Caudoviricetes sp.]
MEVVRTTSGMISGEIGRYQAGATRISGRRREKRSGTRRKLPPVFWG